MRSSLTPPPFYEKINRAIRTAECQLDAAVDDVHRYISRGCPDSDTVNRCRIFVESPASEYSDDFMSPKVLPDFNSPLNGENLASEFQFDHSNVENEEPNISNRGSFRSIGKENNVNQMRSKKNSTTKPKINNIGSSASPNSIDNSENECNLGPGMKGRVLRFDGSKFQVWPPLNSSKSDVGSD